MAKNERINLEEVKEYIRNSSPETSILVAGDSIIERSKKYVKNGKKYKKPKKVAYITLVIVHINSCNGGHLFQDIQVEEYNDTKIAKILDKHAQKKARTGLMQAKLLHEVQICIDISKGMMDCLDEIYVDKRDKDGKKVYDENGKVVKELDLLEEPRKFGVHLDINSKPTEASYIAAATALGWVKNELGVTPSIKPDSYGATNCADHVAREVAS